MSPPVYFWPQPNAYGYKTLPTAMYDNPGRAFVGLQPLRIGEMPAALPYFTGRPDPEPPPPAVREEPKKQPEQAERVEVAPTMSEPPPAVPEAVQEQPKQAERVEVAPAMSEPPPAVRRVQKAPSVPAQPKPRGRPRTEKPAVTLPTGPAKPRGKRSR